MRLIVALLMIAMLAGACGGEDSAPQLSSGSTNPISATTNDTIAATPPTPTANIDFDGTLVFVQGRELWLLEAGLTEPRLLTDNIIPEQVFLSPDARHVVFSTKDAELARAIRSNDSNTTYVFSANLAGSDHIYLTHFSLQFWQIGGWSPDSEWVAIRSAAIPYTLHKLDGSARYEDAFPSNSFQFWLENGDVAVFAYNTRGSGQAMIFDFHSAYTLDMETGQHLPLDVDFAALNSSNEATVPLFEQIEALLDEAGLAVIPRPERNTMPYLALAERNLDSLEFSGGHPCDTWLLGTYDDIGWQTFHTTYDTYRLDSITPLNDGLVLFVQWQLPDCRIGTPHGTLMRLAPDGNVQAVVEGVFGGAGLSSSNNPFEETHIYAVAPDGQQLAWISGSTETWQTSLNLMNLADQTTAPLYQANIAAESGDSVVPFITAVFWLDPEPARP